MRISYSYLLFSNISLADIREGMFDDREFPLSSEMKILSDKLPLLVERGRAKSTVGKYNAGWRGWLKWGMKNSVSTRPAHPFFVALYLTHTFLTKRKKGSVTVAMYGIRWAHHVVGLNSPTDNNLVQLTYEGCLRSCEGEKRRKEPFS